MLIVCAEGMSRIANWTDRSTCVLFGDGAGAVVLDAGENRFCAQLTSDFVLQRGGALHPRTMQMLG